MKASARTEQALSKLLGDIRECYKAHGYVSVQYGAERKRSLDQNALAHTWYEQIAEELREYSAHEVKRECKLVYGVPMLRAESEDFRSQYDGLIKDRFSYEEKLQMMDFFPVTSLMTTDQTSRYLDKVQEAYAKRGVILEFPQ
jgi:ATP phosphoribosyltransferase